MSLPAQPGCVPIRVPVAHPPLHVVRAVAGPATAPPPEQRPGPVFSAEDLLLLTLFADGHCIQGIARRLGLSERTVRRRSRELCGRIGAHATIQVVAWAARRRLI